MRTIEAVPVAKRATFRHGITVLEVLIVMAVVGLLAAIAIPTIQSSRESARKVVCLSKLRQVMIAFDDFSARNHHFPGMDDSHIRRGGPLGRKYWTEQLLPGLGLPKEAKECVIYSCPSDWEHASGEIEPNYHISYAISRGLDLQGQGVESTPSKPVLPGQVRDGSSTTVAMAERLAWPWFAPQMIEWNDFKPLWKRGMRRIYTSTTDFDEYYSECHNNAGKPWNGWAGGAPSFNHVMPPNDNSCMIYPSAANPKREGMPAVTASSMHPRGVHAAFLDGAVRFIADNIDRRVWRALGTIDGGETDISF